MSRIQSGSFTEVRPRVVLTALALVPALLLAACASPEPLPLPEPLDLPYDQGRIWKVEKEGYETGYVFGTFHISDPRVLEIPDAAEEAFVSAKIAAFEYDHENDERPDSEDRIKLPEGTSLISLIGAGPYGKLKNIIRDRTGGSRIPRNDVKPWIFWDSLGGARGTFYTADEESDPNRPVLDEWLQQRAFDEGKRVVGLETLEEGFVKYNSIPLDLQTDLLIGTLDHYHMRRAGAPVVQHYLDGDLGMLEALWQEGLGWYTPEVAKELDFRIVTNRNRIMVERTLPLLEEGTTFVAVGAGHLAGDEGILRLFEQEGFTVTRLQ